jgi:NADPH:quinone reductase-like Zn-dependent oxidoreductase
VKAIVHREYGSPTRVLELRSDVEQPVPAANEVLVRVRASSVNSGDWRAVTADPFIVRLFGGGLLRPKSPFVGVDAAGIAEAIGDEVTDVDVDDEVYGMRNGAFAEYVAGRSFVRKPANLSLAEAAAVPAAACTALQALRDQGNLRSGERVLVNGAGGGVGTFTVQLARAFGATVHATTTADKLELLRSLGADHVIDYEREDFTRAGHRYDLIVDCGGRPSVAAFRRALSPAGRLVLVAAGKGRLGALGRFIGGQLRRRLLRQHVIVFIAGAPFEENLLTLKELIEANKVRPVIDRTYPLERAAEAVAYAATERVAGKVVITI